MWTWRRLPAGPTWSCLGFLRLRPMCHSPATTSCQRPWPLPPCPTPCQNLADSLDVLHKLAVGMDVNVRFNSIHGFEATQVGGQEWRARPRALI